MITKLTYENNFIGEVFIANTFINRFLGYMFQKTPHYDAILIKPCDSIHTFFMNFPIDVLFVNNNMEIIRKVENLKPGKVMMPVKNACMVLEGKVGIFKEIDEGDKMEFI